jgi:hypothetical protein
MPMFAMSQRTTSGTIATASWEVRSAAANRPKLMEIGISINAATASVFGIGRPAAIGVGPTSPQTWLDESDGGAGTGLTTSAVAWGTTAPTVPANFFRRVSTPATVGAGIIWTFPRGLGLPVAGSIVVWVLATSSVADVWGVVEE